MVDIYVLRSQNISYSPTTGVSESSPDFVGVGPKRFSGEGRYDFEVSWGDTHYKFANNLAHKVNSLLTEGKKVVIYFQMPDFIPEVTVEKLLPEHGFSERKFSSVSQEDKEKIYSLYQSILVEIAQKNYGVNSAISTLESRCEG